MAEEGSNSKAKVIGIRIAIVLIGPTPVEAQCQNLLVKVERLPSVKKYSLLVRIDLNQRRK